MTFKTIPHLSGDYQKMIDLRVRVLLQPIGIPASYIVAEKEASDILIGAYDREQLIGCCVLTGRENGKVQLRQMAVETKLQSKGLGAAIIIVAEEIATKQGYTLLFLHARKPIIGFYEKCGYRKVGDEFFEVGLAHHRMEKKLAVNPN